MTERVFSPIRDNKIEAVKPGVRILVRLAKLGRGTSQSIEHINRTVDTFTAIVEGSKVDLLSEVPWGTVVRVASLSNEGDGIVPDSLVMKSFDNDFPSMIVHDYRLFERDGMVLYHFHEIGYLWQMKQDLIAGGDLILLDNPENLERLMSGEFSLEQVIGALKLKEVVENDAWRYALSLLRRYLSEGINLAPDFSSEEIATYPQRYFDLINTRYAGLLDLVGHEHVFEWRSK